MAGLTNQKIVMKHISAFMKNPPEGALGIYFDSTDKVYLLLKGPPNSPYEGGEYIFSIILPKNFPFAPPDIMCLTPSGRFEVSTKICTSFTSFHPNTWSPALNLSVIANSILSFMTDKDESHIGSYSSQNDNTKRAFAVASIESNKRHTTLKFELLLNSKNDK